LIKNGSQNILVSVFVLNSVDYILYRSKRLFGPFIQFDSSVSFWY